MSTQPKEEKYRKIRLSNEKIRATIVDVPGGVDLLLALGWARDETEDALIIPAGGWLGVLGPCKGWTLNVLVGFRMGWWAWCVQVWVAPD